MPGPSVYTVSVVVYGHSDIVDGDGIRTFPVDEDLAGAIDFEVCAQVVVEQVFQAVGFVGDFLVAGNNTGRNERIVFRYGITT